jgi:DNA polymerase (family 10)
VSPFHRTLEQLASLATIRGDMSEAALWARAIDLVRANHIESDGDAGPLFDNPPSGSDPEVLKRLRQMYEAGGWVLVESAIADLPADLRWLFESGAVTIAQLAEIHRELGVISAADIAAAAREHKLRALPGVGADVEAAIVSTLPALRARVPRTPIGRAVDVAEIVLHVLQAIPGVEWAVPVGSLRRGEEIVGDIEILAPTDRPGTAIDSLIALPTAAHVLHRSERRLYTLADRMQIGVRLPAPADAAAELLYLTGSRAHFDWLQTRAASKGLTLTATGLQAADGSIIRTDTESDIYGALGLPFIPAEVRNGDAEIELAISGTLPMLISRADIRGDLHMHSLWSDGRDAIEAMVETCVALGYKYMAITDHSPHSAASRNLSIDGVKKQAEEIAGLREQYPGIAILHGCEVDILPDGRLDFPDHILESLDIVLASLHEHAGHGPAQLLQRYASAMNHPLVTIVTHPSNRVVPSRPGYDLDYDRLFEMAAETGTVLEIDGAPSHLDLNAPHARRAVAAGATVSIDSDCHRAALLRRQMDLGIITARRGWVEPRHVLNTRSLQELRHAIAAKRASR